MTTPTIHVHHGDLPEGVDFGSSVAVDTETLGLNPLRDKLCLVQLSSGDGTCHMVKFDIQKSYEALRLKKLLSDPKVLKLFHFARFDLAALYHHLGVMAAPLYCTKVASKLARTFAPRHGLKDLCTQLLDVTLDKQQQISDWSVKELSPEQQLYAANDVLYLHRLKEALDTMLERSGRTALAKATFDFLPTVSKLDLSGWDAGNLLSHS